MTTELKVIISSATAFIIICIVVFFVGKNAGYDINSNKV